METPRKNRKTDNDQAQSQTSGSSSTEDAVEPDGTPVLEEKDLEENNLTVDEAEDIEWDDQEELDEEAADLEEEDDDEDEDL